MTVSIELKQRRHTNYQELLIFLYLLSDFVKKNKSERKCQMC